MSTIGKTDMIHSSPRMYVAASVVKRGKMSSRMNKTTEETHQFYRLHLAMDESEQTLPSQSILGTSSGLIPLSGLFLVFLATVRLQSPPVEEVCVRRSVEIQF
jgi:hypothetical protein